MTEELYINNFLIELPERAVSQTKQINDIGEVKDRQANYSNSIRIPRTPNNIKAFEMLGIAGNTTRVPYDNVSVKYSIDGIEIISGGKGVIKNTNEFYNLVVYDGNISMSDLLGTLELKDLDFSAHNHTLTQSLFINSFGNTSGYIYAIGDFFDDPVNAGINVSFTSPSFFMHSLFSMIFAQKGYTISGDIFSNADFLSRLISMNNGFERVIADNLAQVYSRDNSGDPTVNDTFPVPTIQRYTIDSYTAASTSVHRVETSGSINVTYAQSAVLEVVVGGVVAHTETIAEGSIAGAHPVNYTIEVQANTGQDIEIKLGFISEDVGGTERIYFSTNYVTTIDTNNPYIDIDFNQLVGEKKQLDFVKDILQRFGLIFRKVRNKQEFEFIQMEELLKDKTNAEDWSSKYSRVTDESYTPNYAKLNRFKTTYDDSDGEPTFADGAISVANENLAEEKTVITSIFKASLEKNSLAVLNHWAREEEEGVITYEPNDDSIRMFKINLKSDTINYRFDIAVENFSEYTGQVPYLDPKSVYYQLELDKYYNEFENILDTYKKMKIEILLNTVDLYNLDFFKLKYFNQLGRYFYLNKVSNFKRSKPTVCEFVEVEDRVLIGGNVAGNSTGSSVVTGNLTVVAGTGELQGSANGLATVEGVLST